MADTPAKIKWERDNVIKLTVKVNRNQDPELYDLFTREDGSRSALAKSLMRQGLICRLSKTTGGIYMEKRYVVVDRPIRGDGDWSQTVHRTAEEANEAAKTQWWYLTKAEKQRRHIAAYVVTESDLDPDDVEEYGLDSDYPWMGAPNMNDFPGSFDSAALTEEDGDDDDD